MQDNDKYICDDRPIEPSERIKKMTESELEDEFQRLFGEYLNEDAGNQN